MSLSAGAQPLLEEAYTDCKGAEACLYCGDRIAQPKENLTKYFKWKIEHAPYRYDAKYGKITYELYVDSNGHACVISVLDRGLNYALKNDIRKWLNASDIWTAAVKNGHTINSTVLVQFDTHREWFGVTFAKPGDVETRKKDADMKDAPKIFTYVEQMPVPPFKIGEYLSENVKYPEEAIKAGIEGRVIVKFTVMEDGSIDSARIFKGVAPLLDEEAVRVVKEMPRWKPGMQEGKAVRVYFTLPIQFKLEDPAENPKDK